MVSEILDGDVSRKISLAYMHGGYFSVCNELINIRKTISDNETKENLNSLIDLCSLSLDEQDGWWVFRPEISYNSESIFDLSSLTVECLDNIDVLQKSIEIPCIKSTLLNILLETRKKKDYAKELLSNYDEYIFNRDDFFISAGKNIKRYIAVVIRYFPKDEKFISEIENRLVDLLERYCISAPCIGIEISGYLRHYRLKSYAARTVAAMDRANVELCDNKAFFMADKCAQEALYWHDLNNDCQESAEALIKAAQTKELLADSLGSPFSISYYLKAISLLKKIKNDIKEEKDINTKIELLQQKIEDMRHGMHENMQIIKTKDFCISEVISGYINRLDGNSFHEIINQFAELFAFNKSRELERALKQAKEFNLTDLFSSHIYTNDGRKIGAVPSVDFGEEVDGNHPKVLNQLKRNYLIHVQLCSIVINKIINNQDLIDKDSILKYFVDIVLKNKFISDEHKPLFIKGLKLGYEGDYITSLHLLAPQLEYLIRQILIAKGAYTKVTDADNNENEVALGALAKHKDFEGTFGSRLSYEINELFCSPFGPNIRNNIAHGLAGCEDESLNTYPYAWWLILRILNKIANKPDETILDDSQTNDVEQ